jgi:4a-hydroxytetrahydrobiopterin dehydratase
MDLSSLLTKECVSCTNKTPKLTESQIQQYLRLCPQWHLIRGKLEREIKTKNFEEALSLANQIGKIAQEQNHHPDLFVSWGLIKISIFTHANKSLSENDLILAAKIDAHLLREFFIL